MLKTRVIPALLVKDGGLVKTERFKNARYVGDPINAIKIFNDKEVDELTILDISATRRGTIDFELLERVNKEAFMPLGYGGGIRSILDIRRILGLGFEKVVLNTATLDNPSLITQAASECGCSSVVVCVDVVHGLLGGAKVFDHRRTKPTTLEVRGWCRECEKLGAGEILLYSVDRDGTFMGYDLDLIKSVAGDVTIPLVALGGAAGVDDLRKAVEAGASAVAAGSMFVYFGPHKAVLITYPDKGTLKRLFADMPTGR